MTWQLRVTRRALVDLGLGSQAGPAFDVVASIDLHPLLAAFVAKRRDSPRGQERTLRVRAQVYNLHGPNPWRGVTWHDEQNGVCWLIAASPHDYALFESRDAAGTLAPTEEDYADLALSLDPIGADSSVERFLTLAYVDGAELTQRAWDEPGTQVVGCLAYTVDVALFVELIVVDQAECREVYVALAMPPHPGFDLPDDLITACAAALLPGAAYDDIDFYHPSYPGTWGEQGQRVVLRWRVP